MRAERYVCRDGEWDCPHLVIGSDGTFATYRCGVGGGQLCEEDLGETYDGAGCPLGMEQFEEQRESYQAAREEFETMGKRIQWGQPQPGSDKPLWEEAAELRRAGKSWAELTEELQRRHGLELSHGSVRLIVKRWMKKAGAGGGMREAG